MCLLEDSKEPPSNDSPSVALPPTKLVQEVLLPPLQRGIQLQIDAARGCPDLLELVRVCAYGGERIQSLIPPSLFCECVCVCVCVYIYTYIIYIIYIYIYIIYILFFVYFFFLKKMYCLYCLFYFFL